MSVYVLEAGETGRFKIGFTGSPVHKRTSALQTGCHEELRVVGFYRWLTREDERLVHGWLHRFHVRGEWFALDRGWLLDTTRRLEALDLGRSLIAHAMSGFDVHVEDRPVGAHGGETVVWRELLTNQHGEEFL